MTEYEYAEKVNVFQNWVRERIFLGLSVKEYLRSLFKPFNIVAGIIILAGLPFMVMRFTQGLAAVTYASQDQPWSIFLSWGLFTGVPLASTGFIMTAAVYIFGLKDYHPLVRPAILTGFLGYFFAVVFLLFDLGRFYRLPYPLVISHGTSSVLFLVGWTVPLYLTTQFVEFCPSIFEWLGANRFRRWALKVTIGATIFGVVLSTFHQSALGALFLLSPGKLHPLWYSDLLPGFFFISSIFAGLSVVIIVALVSQTGLKSQISPHQAMNYDSLTLGLGKAASFVMLSYFFLKWIGVAHGNHWNFLNTSWGHWFLVEIFIFVLLPCFLFAYAVRKRSVGLTQFTAIFTILGVAVNRFNVSLIALNWKLPHREFIHWKELMIVIAIITIEILTYRWIVNRMPVHREHPQYKEIGMEGNF